MRAVLILAATVLLLLAAVPAAGAATVTGEPVNAKKLTHAITLPNGKKSSYTFTLVRDSDGTRVKGYAVGSTKYFESLNFSDYYRVSRATAFAAFNSDFTPDAKFAYKRLTSNGVTYNVLVRVYYDIYGE